MGTERAPWLFALALAVSGCLARSETVSRMSDGVVHEGRFIAAEAYALYARGAVLEARRERERALEYYSAALELDPDAPEILARVATLDCELAAAAKDPAAERAETAVQRALAVDPTSSVALAAGARCDARFGRSERALERAFGAARADPESMATQLLVVELAEAAGKLDLARTWLDALVARSPESRAAWLYVAGFAERNRDAGRALRARRALGGEPTKLLERALLDAIHDDAREAARLVAGRLRISPGELAARAAVEGASAFAREQAELVLAADPSDADAWIALLALDDLSRNREHWTQTLKAVPEEPGTPPSPSARRLHAELLERLAGPEARRAWDSAF